MSLPNIAPLYEKIEGNNLDWNISVKPTHIGLDISIEEAKVKYDQLQSLRR